MDLAEKLGLILWVIFDLQRELQNQELLHFQ